MKSPRIEPPPDGMPCEICGVREATRATRYFDRDQKLTLYYCDHCAWLVPVGDTEMIGVNFDGPPRDPDALCDRCGARGTIAQVKRVGREVTLTRYCTACWPQIRAEMTAEQRRKEEEMNTSWRVGSTALPEALRSRPTWKQREESVTWESRSWSDVREFIALVSKVPINDDQLARMKGELEKLAAEMDDPMPDDIKAFLEGGRE